MSTRSMTDFVHGDTVRARIYRHSDGYPEGAGVDIYRFFGDVEAQTADRRFDDASYLAAKYVVWLAREFSRYSSEAYDAARGLESAQREEAAVAYGREHPLAFLSVGVAMEYPCDIAFIYVVDCSAHDERGYPLVRCHAVDHSADEVVAGEQVEIPPRPQQRPGIAPRRRSRGQWRGPV